MSWDQRKETTMPRIEMPLEAYKSLVQVDEEKKAVIIGHVRDIIMCAISIGEGGRETNAVRGKHIHASAKAILDCLDDSATEPEPEPTGLVERIEALESRVEELESSVSQTNKMLISYVNGATIWHL
jgi:hypothetical protein